MKSQLEDGEKLFAFLDDVYVICRPTRVLQVFRLLEHELGRKVCICVHQGSTQIWNRGGVLPAGVAQQPEWRTQTLWCGEEIQSLPLTKQGLTMLGAPVGQVEFVQAQLTKKGGEP